MKGLSVKRHSKVYDLNHVYRFIRMRGPGLKGFAEMAVSNRDEFGTPHVHSTPAEPWSKRSSSPRIVRMRKKESQDPLVSHETVDTKDKARSFGIDSSEFTGHSSDYSGAAEVQSDFFDGSTFPGSLNRSPERQNAEEGTVDYQSKKRTARLGSDGGSPRLVVRDEDVDRSIAVSSTGAHEGPAKPRAGKNTM